jgi:hypothetical protein
MIKSLNRLVGLLVLFAIVCVPVLADPLSQRIQLRRDVNVNGTLVKKGIYKAVYDEQKAELTLLKGKKIVAKAPARIEKVSYSTGSYSTHAVTNALLSVIFKDNNVAVIGNGDKVAGENSQ